MNSIESKLELMYLDYVNNFLTVGAFADYYDLSINGASAIIESGKKIHEAKV